MRLFGNVPLIVHRRDVSGIYWRINNGSVIGPSLQSLPNGFGPRIPPIWVRSAPLSRFFVNALPIAARQGYEPSTTEVHGPTLRAR